MHTSTRLDNPNVDEDEPEIFFNAYIHAREAITFEIVYDLAQWLLTNYGTVDRAQDIVNDREIWILPVVNPDGVEYNAATSPREAHVAQEPPEQRRRKTSASTSTGTSGFNWGFDNSGSSPDPTATPTGGHRLSEETFRLTATVAVINMVLDYHSYSNLHICAFGYDNFHPGDYEAMFCLASSGRVATTTP